MGEGGGPLRLTFSVEGNALGRAWRRADSLFSPARGNRACRDRACPRPNFRMSALLPKATDCCAAARCRDGPFATFCTAENAARGPPSLRQIVNTIVCSSPERAPVYSSAAIINQCVSTINDLGKSEVWNRPIE
jgi:hypothetical protein